MSHKGTENLDQWISNLNMPHKSPRGPIKTQIFGLHPRISDCFYLGWYLRTCIPSECPADAAYLVTAFWETLI